MTLLFLTFQGSYIPPVLRDSAPNPLSDNSAAGYGYQSFGSTDRMGRRSPCHVGPTANPTKGMSTLERSTSKAKIIILYYLLLEIKSPCKFFIGYSMQINNHELCASYNMNHSTIIIILKCCVTENQ